MQKSHSTPLDPKTQRERAVHALTRVGLADRLEHRPNDSPVASDSECHSSGARNEPRLLLRTSRRGILIRGMGGTF